MKNLFEKNQVTSSLEYEIAEIEENIGEYCLTLRSKNLEIKGIYSKMEDKLKEKQLILCRFFLDKSHEQIKIYIKYFIKGEQNEDKQISNKKKYIYNFKPESIIYTLNKMELFEGDLEEENVFVCLDLSNNKIKLFDPINIFHYYLDYKYIKDIIQINKNDFIYLKYYLIDWDNIICNNLTFIQKANEFQIFNILDKRIHGHKLKEFQEVKEIVYNDKMDMKDKKKEDESITLAYSLAKVIYKSIEEQYILLFDKSNRIIKLEYEELINLKLDMDLNFDLCDLLIILNCKIIKDKDNKFYYILRLEEKSLLYKSKKLIFNKNISINNYTLLNINFPDFQKNNNYYDRIIISNFEEMQINSKQQMYIFKYDNTLFNEIIPFIITIKNKTEAISFKFFIVHNLMNNINIFINYISKDRCSIEYCYYNYFDEAKRFHDITINERKYSIRHYNSFDNINIIGFILINVPSDENIYKIKKITKKEIISSQVWLTASQKNNKIIYESTQILDVDEAKPKTYYEYDLKSKKYSKFENFYFNMFFFNKQWPLLKEKAYNYFEKIRKEYELIDKKEFNLIKTKYNVSFIPESADFYTYKIYINLILFDFLENIRNDNFNNIEEMYYAWNDFLKLFFKLIEKLTKFGKLFTYHQKMRIIHSFCENVFEHNDCKYNYSSEFLYIDEALMNPENSYLLAYKFNIDIINNLTNKSALTKGYKQLDSFILKNYLIVDDQFKNEKNYSFINEPISLMKYHLLINYENFLIIDKEEVKNKDKQRANQDCSNRITYINERDLFQGSSTNMLGKDNAFPISVECIHENSHEKKNSKNNEEITPLIGYKGNKNVILKEHEEGRYIESLIGSQEFINQLKNPKNQLGELMDSKYFIQEDFNELHEKFKEIKNSEKNEKKKLIYKSNIEYNPFDDIGDKKEDKNYETNEMDFKTVEDYEKHYLINGEFIYPDSVPYHEYPLGENFEISQVEKDYLNKYKKRKASKKKKSFIRFACHFN